VSITGETTKKIDAPPSTRPAQKAIALAVEEFRWFTLVDCLIVSMLDLLNMLSTDVLLEDDQFSVSDISEYSLILLRIEVVDNHVPLPRS
jgi:hypothetical protein